MEVEVSKTDPINEKLVAEIKRRHDGDKWLLVFELPTGTGMGGPLTYAGSFVDAFALGAWPSMGGSATAYEMKASRADFLKELKAPRKRRAALRFSNRFYFITPQGIAKREEIPAECGLIEVPVHLKLPLPLAIGNVVVEAPFRESIPPTWNFLTSVWRRVYAQGRADCARDRDRREA